MVPLETVGQIFQKTREEKGININEIALQTNMGKRYLDALESDNYDLFPSETHILGFIRNYSSYLELDPDQMIDIYKRTILQETPAPYEELTAPSKAGINPSILIVLLAVLAIGGLTALLLKGGKKHGNTVLDNNPGTVTNKITVNNDKVFRGVTLDRFFKPGEIYVFPVEGSEKSMVVENASNAALTISLMNTRYTLPEGKKRLWDFDGDNRSELAITVLKISNGGAFLSLSRVPQPINTKKTNNNTGTSAATIKGNTIFKSQEQVEINLMISAKGFATVNWIKDRQERGSKALQAGASISILAKNTIQITASNPFNLSLNLNNKTLDIQTSRAVVGLLFKWQRNPDDGLFHLKYERIH